MRILSLDKSGLNKLRAFQFELKTNDFNESIRSLAPGEWCLIQSAQEQWIGFINPNVEEKHTCAYVVTKISKSDLITFSPESFIRSKIESALEKRHRFLDYGKNSRIFYGISDGLPGLIIDHFENASIIQINSAGIDRFRDFIKETVCALTGTTAYFLDNEKYRSRESLPVFETDKFPELRVFENGLKYIIRPEVLQKIGFYYDHRENRYQLMNLLRRLYKKPSRGIDLFCYAGAWGMSALSAGVERMLFIDQGDLQNEVETALKLNDFSDRGEFIRSDVFKFLDGAHGTQEYFDLVLCDPPAFAKSPLQKSQALDGYSKLHRKVFKILSNQSIVAFSSCTHYVTHEEFQKNILDASVRENRKIQLIYAGIQGLDHPITSLSDKANYIKSYFYFVE